MLAIVLIMLASNTAAVFINFRFYVMQIPSIGTVNWPSIIHEMIRLDISAHWLIRLNVRLISSPPTLIFLTLVNFQFFLSDVVVVWRAWALWPDSRRVHWTLSIFMGITLGMGFVFESRYFKF